MKHFHLSLLTVHPLAIFSRILSVTFSNSEMIVSATIVHLSIIFYTLVFLTKCLSTSRH